MARGEIPWDHPSFLSLTRAEALAAADVVILAGTPLDFRMKFGRAIPADARIVQLDLDETLIGQNRAAEVGLVGNLGQPTLMGICWRCSSPSGVTRGCLGAVWLHSRHAKPRWTRPARQS